MAKTPKQKLDLIGKKYRLVYSKKKQRASRRVKARKLRRRRTSWYPRTLSGKAASKTVTNASLVCGWMLSQSELYPNIYYKNPQLQQVFDDSLQRYLIAHIVNSV